MENTNPARASILIKDNKEWLGGDNVADQIKIECDLIKGLLLSKNAKYGNSALDPIRVFSSADTLEQIRVRMDDKLSRIRTSDPADTEDTITDLIGYLILYKVAQNGN